MKQGRGILSRFDLVAVRPGRCAGSVRLKQTRHQRLRPLVASRDLKVAEGGRGWQLLTPTLWLALSAIEFGDGSGTQQDKYGIPQHSFRRRHKSQDLLRSAALFHLSGPTFGSLHKKSVNVPISALFTHLHPRISPIPGYTATVVQELLQRPLQEH